MAETKSGLYPIVRGRENYLVSFSFLCGIWGTVSHQGMQNVGGGVWGVRGRVVLLNGKGVGLKIGQRGKVSTLKTFRKLLTGLRFFKGNFCNVSADSYIGSAKQIQNSTLGTLGILEKSISDFYECSAENIKGTYDLILQMTEDLTSLSTQRQGIDKIRSSWIRKITLDVIKYWCD